MALSHQRLKPGIGDVGVNLCGRNIGVSQHLLNASEICAMIDQVGREGVAQNMG